MPGITNSTLGNAIADSGNITTIEELFAYNNAATGNLYGGMTVLVVWMIIFLKLERSTRSPSIAAMTASFVTFILSFLMTSAGFIPDETLILNSVVLFVTVVWAYTARRR